jgi:hypothetical protein
MLIILGLLPNFLPAPLVAFFTGLTAAGGGTIVLYEKIRLPSLKEENESLKQRVGELPKTTKYSTLNHKQLKATALNLSKDIRDLLKEQEKTTKVQKQQQEFDLTIVNSPEVKAFHERFYALALNVRQEIQERLPDYAQTHDIKDIILSNAIDVKYIQAIADELERLAAALPTK